MESIQISILIPTKDRQDILQKCVQYCTLAIENISAEIIVVNDSKTQSLDFFSESNLVKVYTNPKSGVASARNYAAKMAQGSVLLFLDDDMLISKENIETTLTLHEKYRNSFINLNWTYPPELIEKIKQFSFGRFLIHYGFTSLKGWNGNSNWNNNELFKVHGITSQYLSCKREDFYASGGYNEGFPFAGYEDSAFSETVNNKGFNIFIYPLSTLYHNETDRVDIKPWMARKTRGGVTVRTAFELGYKAQIHQYSWFKKIAYSSLIPMKPLLYGIYKALPNRKIFDFFSHRIIKLLLGIHIFDGYMNYQKHLK